MYKLINLIIHIYNFKTFYSNFKINLTMESVKDKIEKSTIHAIPNIVRSTNRPRKIYWSVCLTISLAFCCYYLVTGIFLFFQYQTITLFEMIDNSNSCVPMISVCNSQRYATKYALVNK